MNLYSLPPLLTLCCFIGLAALTLHRGPRTRARILFSLICIISSFLYVDILCAFNLKSAATALAISRIDHAFIVYLFPLYIHFFHEYLNVRGRKWVVRCAYGFAAVMMCLTPTPVYIADMQRHFYGYYARGGRLFPLFGAADLLVTVYVLVLIARAIGRERSSTRRNGLKYMLAGFGGMGLLNGLSALPVLGVSVYPPGCFGFVPLAFFYVGLFKHDLLDMGLLIRKGLIYSLLTALLTGLYALIVTVANRLCSGLDFGGSFYFTALFFLLVVWVFGPLNARTQRAIDRMFFKGRYDYQKTIKEASRIIAAVRDLDEISHRLMETLFRAMMVENCALYLASSPSSDFYRHSARSAERTFLAAPALARHTALARRMAHRHRPVVRSNLDPEPGDGAAAQVHADMDGLQAAVVLPLVFNGALAGCVAMGEKLSGDLVSAQDMDLLETLANQTALAIENARSYQRITELNENLEATVRERTRELEAALIAKEKTQEQLIRSESLAAIGQLVAGTAHELNNPLASATSLLQSAIEELGEADLPVGSVDDALVDDLRFAEKELGRAKTIVASLLGLSRQTRTYAEPVDLNAVVSDALQVLSSRSKRCDAAIIRDLAADLPRIQGNFANLGQVVLNIVQNAMDAVAGRNGKIFLATRHDRAGRQVVFACRDTGPGIPEAMRADIFKPFFTTKDVGQGTGLGLYICHEIIDRHGGSLVLEPGGRKGAAFRVSLPVDDPPAADSPTSIS